MGVTVLNVEQGAFGEYVALHFSREGSGAERWRQIVDSLDEAIIALEPLRGFVAERPDGETSLGRGARCVVPWRALPLVIAKWDAVPAVRAALASGELRVDGELGSSLVLALARRWVDEAFGESGSGVGALRNCFE